MRRALGQAARRSGAALVAIAATVSIVGCAGGSPLLHPAHTLEAGVIRAAGGVSANVAVGSIAEDVRTARDQATRNVDVPGTPGSNPQYAKGALVVAAVAPGLAPFISARVGVGGHAEGGIAYTGRGARIDLRRSFESGSVALSIGAGVTGAFYGRQQGSPLPNVELTALHGFGADVPILVGWRSDGGFYELWAGVRAGFERDQIESLTSEPKSVSIGTPPISLDATRYYGGGLVGVGTGFRHVHVALELDVAYQSATGEYNGTHVAIGGVALSPATALWWTF
jgi:hypothetical protein